MGQIGDLSAIAHIFYRYDLETTVPVVMIMLRVDVGKESDALHSKEMHRF